MTILFSPKQNLPFTIVILPPMNHSDTQKFSQMIPKTTLKYPDNYTACNMCIDDPINESYVPKCYINEISTTLQRFLEPVIRNDYPVDPYAIPTKLIDTSVKPNEP